MFKEECEYCGERVMRAEAQPRSDGEKVLHFCSVECRKDWDDERDPLASLRKGK